MREETLAKIKKERTAGESIIPILIKLLEEKNITIPVKSEKTSLTQMNRLKTVIGVLKDVFGTMAFKQLGLDGKCCRTGFPNDMTNAEYCEFRLGFGGVICYEIYGKLKIGKERVYYYNNSIASAKSIYSGDKEAYAEATFNDEEYTICWKPEVRTQTKKGKKKDKSDELIVKFIKKFNTHPVTGYEALPYGCRLSDKSTPIDIFNMVDIMMRRLNEKTPPPLCSEKQAYWCAKFLGVNKEVAMNLNYYQAVDILNVYFEKIPVTQEEYDDVKAFYIAKLKKFI